MVPPLDTFNKARWDSFSFVLNLTLLLAPAPELVSVRVWADTASWSPCMGQIKNPGALAWDRRGAQEPLHGADTAPWSPGMGQTQRPADEVLLSL